MVGVEADRKTQDRIYYGVSGGILVVGLFVSIVMVKDRKVKRNYVKDSQGVVRRHAQKLEKDDRDSDTGSDIDMGVQDTSLLLKARKMATCEYLIVIVKQTCLAIAEDKMCWLVFYATMVNKMMKEKLGTIIVIWLAHHVLTEAEQSNSPEKVTMTQTEADEVNGKINQIAQFFTFISVPVFGYI